MRSAFSYLIKRSKEPIRIGVRSYTTTCFYFVFLSPRLATLLPEKVLFQEKKRLQRLANDCGREITIEVWQSREKRFVPTPITLQPGADKDVVSFMRSIETVSEDGTMKK